MWRWFSNVNFASFKSQSQDACANKNTSVGSDSAQFPHKIVWCDYHGIAQWWWLPSLPCHRKHSAHHAPAFAIVPGRNFLGCTADSSKCLHIAHMWRSTVRPCNAIQQLALAQSILRIILILCGDDSVTWTLRHSSPNLQMHVQTKDASGEWVRSISSQ